jgi:hypothetical protein
MPPQDLMVSNIDELHKIIRRLGFQYRTYKGQLPTVFRTLIVDAMKLLRKNTFPQPEDSTKEALEKAPSQHRDLMQIFAALASREEEKPKKEVQNDSVTENKLFTRLRADAPEFLPRAAHSAADAVSLQNAATEKNSAASEKQLADEKQKEEQQKTDEEEKEEGEEAEKGKPKKKRKKKKKRDEKQLADEAATPEEEEDKNGEHEETRSTAQLFEAFFWQHPNGGGYRTEVCNLPAARRTEERLTDQAWVELTNAVSNFLPTVLPSDKGDVDRTEMWANVRRWGLPLGHAGWIEDHDFDCIQDLVVAAILTARRLLSNTVVLKKLEDYADYLQDWVNARDSGPPVSYFDESRWRDFLHGRAYFNTQAEYTSED